MPEKHIGDILKEKNIILKGADELTQAGYTLTPNAILRSGKALTLGAGRIFSLLLSYAWHNDYCFPGQERLAEDCGSSEPSIRTWLKELQQKGLIEIKRRGQGKTNLYVIDVANVKNLIKGKGKIRKS